MGEKASLNLEKRYRLLVFKGKSYTCKNAKKHHRLCLSSVINSLEFFLFTVVFLQPFFLFCFSCIFPSLNSFSCYIPWLGIGSFPVPSTCELGIGSFSVPSRISLNLLLLAVRLLVYCSSITSTLMRSES